MKKRVEQSDLPFFIELKKHLVRKKFMCPKPISNKEGSYINQIKDKPCVINSFLKGSKATIITKNHCQQLGENLAKLHVDTYDFKFSRQNNLNQQSWKQLFENFRHYENTKYNKLFNKISLELEFLQKKMARKSSFGSDSC